MRGSQLLQCQVPEDLAFLLRQEGIDPARAWLCTDTDLNLAGSYEEVFLLVDDDRLVTVGRLAGRWPQPLRINLARNTIQEIRTRQGIGGGFLEALVEGVYVEVLAYSNARADLFHKVAAKLKIWVAGQRPSLTAEDDVDPRKCPTCGMTLEFKGDLCRQCLNRGAIFTRVIRLMKPYRGWAALMMLVLLAAIGLTMIPPQLTKILVDQVINPTAPEAAAVDFVTRQRWLMYLVVALVGIQVLRSVLDSLNGRLSSFVATQFSADMRQSVLTRLTQLSVDYYDRHGIGQLVSRAGNDTLAFYHLVYQVAQGFLAQIVVVIVTGAMLFSLSWQLALWTLLPAPLVILASTFYWRRVYPRHFRVWDATSRLMGSLNTILSGIRVVKAFGQERREQDRYARTTSYLRDANRRVEYATSLFNPSMGFLFSLGGPIVWFVGGRNVIGGELTLGKLMAFLAYLGMFYAPLTQMTQLTNWLTQFATAAQRTFEILDTVPQIVEPQSPKPLPNPQGTIRFENVTFGYSRHEPVLKNVSLEIRAGEHIGIVGKSGSGKTTLINLLARFYDADEGRVEIDGMDVRHIRSEDLRRAIGVVLQEPFLFRGTIYDNIVYGRHGATPEEVLAASKTANAHRFIMRHSLGYDTYIGERGAGLSGGERQRISIARAILYDPTILILDEATSNVDTESEQLIQEALARVTAGRTTIAIAHRLSTLKTADRILVIDQGRVVEQGTHEELLALGGLYHRLVKIQTELAREPSIDSLAKQKGRGHA